MILDTNALSAFVDGVPQVGAAVRAAHEMVIPAIVLGGIPLRHHAFFPAAGL